MKAEAINRSCSGPVARASGVTRDLRKDEPYLAYDDFDFDVCCDTAGDCFARYQVRMAEMRESMKIIGQAIENLPAGPVNIGDLGTGPFSGTGPFFGEETHFANQRQAEKMDLSPSASRVILPSKNLVHSTIEGLISHFEMVMPNRGFASPCEEIYCATEAPNGELGFYIVGDGSQHAYRARCRPPSLMHFAVFPHLIRGHTLSDIVAVLGSLNIIAAELDR